MLIAWRSKRWWNFCMTEVEKKEVEQIFNIYNMEVWKHFARKT